MLVRDLALQISDIELDLTDDRGVGVVTLELITQLSLQGANLLSVGLSCFPKRSIDILKLLDLFRAQLKGFLYRLKLSAILPITSIAGRRAATWKLRGQGKAEKQHGNDVLDQSHLRFFLHFMSAPWGCTALEHVAAGNVYRRL